MQLEKEIKELVNPDTGMVDKKFTEIINCPLCGKNPDHHEELFIKNGYTFVRCLNCELMFTNPQVKEEFLAELYGKSKANDLWVEVQASTKEKSWKKDYYQNCISFLENHLNSKIPRVLDVGCGVGYFLEVLNSFRPEWDGNGLEISQKAYEVTQNKGLPVKQCFLSDLPENETYDAFTLFGVLEHLPAPKSIIDEMKMNIPAGEDALVLAVVPNAYSLYHMFIQSDSVSFDGRNHLIYFSGKTLRALFEQEGAEILELDTILTGLDNIKRQIQWYPPYSDVNTTRFIPEKIKDSLEDGTIEKLMQQHNLGLRLRILARITG